MSYRYRQKALYMFMLMYVIKNVLEKNIVHSTNKEKKIGFPH
jgi:hypothetical protein